MSLLLGQLEPLIASFFEQDVTGHDLEHAVRVKNLALYIAKREGGDQKIIEIAALVHDVFDWKFKTGSDNRVLNYLKDHLSDEELSHVLQIANSISFKGALTEVPRLTLEGMIVQDADRLDAIGAMGVARAFAYGGHKGQKMYDPAIEVQTHHNFSEYQKKQSTSINHFYEKLLRLKDLMNTETAKGIAERRHQFMQRFLTEFLLEWHQEEFV